MASINPAELVRETYQCVVESSEKLYRPFMLLLHSQLADAMEPQERIAVLSDICDHHVDYLLPFNLPNSELGSIYLECKSLIHYNEILISLLEKPANRSTLQCNKDLPRPKLEQYIYMQSLRDLDIRHYMAFIQAYALYCRKHQEHPDMFIPTLSFAMLQTWNCLDQMYSTDIISFCKHLYMGESVRQHEIGLLGDNECLNIRTLEVAFRNRCFDEYIRIRLKAIKTEMDADNDRLYPPTELDYMQELLHEDSCVYEREVGFEQFRGSQAYHDSYYIGRPDVLKMAGYFIQYLRNCIDRIHAQQSQPATTQINHNYYAGSVHDDHSRNINVQYE